MGLSHQDLADRLEIDPRNAYELETGTQNLSLLRLERVSVALGVTVPQLVGDEDPASIVAAAAWQATLARLGWTVLDGPGQRRWAVQVWAPFGTRTAMDRDGLPVTVGHARRTASPQRRADKMALVRACGESMVPRIVDGAWCLVQRPATELRVRTVVLAWIPGEDPSENPWHFKQIGAVETTDDDTLRVRLDSPHPAFESVWVSADESAAGPRIVAELVEIVGV